MGQALTAPFLLVALVLCVAGVAKLWRPMPAARALATARLPGGPTLVRAFATGELALGGWALLEPRRAIAVGLCGVFLLFSVLAAVLARRAAACGCFGSGDAPASVAQSGISAALALVAALAAAWPAHGIGWVLGRPPSQAVALLIGLAGAAYATVLAYTQLPSAWSAWGRV